jgi:hypothetical protein
MQMRDLAMRASGQAAMLRAAFGLSLLAALTLAGPTSFANAKTMAKPKVDLAEMVQGSYSGDVISDARGSSRSDVEVTLTKTGPNTISVVSDYGRIPQRTFKLTKVMSTIQNVGGTEVFLLELEKSPPQLTLTIDDASWSGRKTGS